MRLCFADHITNVKNHRLLRTGATSVSLLGLKLTSVFSLIDGGVNYSSVAKYTVYIAVERDINFPNY